jgi:hypothetical protein
VPFVEVAEQVPFVEVAEQVPFVEVAEQAIIVRKAERGYGELVVCSPVPSELQEIVAKYARI